jgi:hypothetical protein
MRGEPLATGPLGAPHGASPPVRTPHEAAVAFAALLWEEVLAAALGPSGLGPGGSLGEVYGPLATSALAEALGRAGGGGLVAAIERWLGDHAR